MKKTLAMLLTFVMLLSCLSVTAFAAAFDEGYLGTWTGMLYDDGGSALANATLIVEESTCTLTVEGEPNSFTAPYYSDDVFWSDDDSTYIELYDLYEDKETGVTTIWAEGYYGDGISFGGSMLTKQTSGGDNEEESKSGTTEITATVENTLTYKMVIPSAVTMTEAGVKEIGAPSVENVKFATDDTVISYTATGTQLALVGGTATMATSYYTDSEGETAMPSTAIEVYKSKALVDPLTTLYVGVAQEAWDAAENGTYKATVTFNFEAEEKEATCEVDTDAMYRVFKIDDENVYLAIYTSYEGFDAVWTMGFSMPKEAFGTELAVGDCLHIFEEGFEKCIAPETHGLYNEVVIGSIELSGNYLFVVPAGATYSIDDSELYVHYGEKQHYVGGGKCSWALNGVNLSNGDTGTISEGDAFVGTSLPD